MKIGWNLVKKRDEFWVKVVRDKYRCGTDVIPVIDKSRSGSNIWSGIKKTWDQVQSSLEIMQQGDIRWSGEKSGLFTVKSAYRKLHNEPATVDPLWGKLWKIRVPERCSLFLWLATHKKLLTNASRRTRKLVNDDLCTVCGEDSESLTHVLRDCRNTAQLWKELVNPQIWNRFTSLDFSSWFHWNMTSTKTKEDVEWSAIFALTCWWIWRRRNHHVFENKSVSNNAIIMSVRASVSSMEEAQARFCKGKIAPHVSSTVVTKWQPLCSGLVKLNVDGAFSHRTHEISCGGVIRDHMGN